MSHPNTSVATGTCLLVLALLRLAVARPFRVQLNAAHNSDYGEYTFSTERDLNRFDVSLSSLALLDQQDLWLVFESQNAGLSLSLSQTFQTPRLLRIDARSGNVLFVLTRGLYNGRFTFLRENPALAIEVFQRRDIPKASLTYRLTFRLGRSPQLQFNTRYFIFMDPLKKEMALDMEYPGTAAPEKLRFQVNVLQKKRDFQVAGRLDYGERSYALNNIFGNVVGGILAEPDTPLCRTGTCKARLEVVSTKTKLISVEAFTSRSIESVNATGVFGVYGRTTPSSLVSVYELPFDQQLRKRDVSVLLVPVLGTTELFVHASSLPLSLEGYTWKDTSPIAKRLTVTRKLLDRIRAKDDPIFIAVRTTSPSEFYLRVEAHRAGLSGTIHPGISEHVSLQRGQTTAFLYRFEAHESQNANFELRLDKLQGKTTLLLYPCATRRECHLSRDTWKSSRLLRGSNTLGYSAIAYNQPCGDSTAKFHACWFLVVLRARSDSTFELSLHERDFHRLLIPGHVTDLNLLAGQTAFFKLSNPFAKDLVSRVSVSFFPHYGSFSAYFSKIQRFPSLENSLLSRDFHGPKAQLTHIVDSVEVNASNIDDAHIQGPLYIGLRAATASSLSLKYIHPVGLQPPVHYLPEGAEVKGHLGSAEEVAYFRIRVSSSSARDSGSDHVVVHLTPITGKFGIFASQDGHLPTATRSAYHSEDNNLQLPVPEGSMEYILGVQLSPASLRNDVQNGQFFIRFGGTATITRLRPGAFLGDFFRDSNLFAIEVSPEMANLLLIKNAFGPVPATLCANFTTSDAVALDLTRCQYALSGNQTALFLDTNELFDQCSQLRKAAKVSHCYLLCAVSGSEGGSFRLGFTFNGHPFQLADDSLLHLPVPLRIDANINFVLHLPSASRAQLTFNSNGKHARVFSRLTTLASFDEQFLVNFPNANDFDAANQKTFGHQTEIVYDKSTVAAQGKDALLLLSVRPNTGKTTDSFYASDGELTLRVVSLVRELHRSVVAKEHIAGETWTFFKLFAGPRVFRVRATVTSSSSVHLEARLAKGLQTDVSGGTVALGFQFVEVFANDQNEELQNRKISSGYYTLAVKASKAAQVSLFWNSEDEEDAVSLLPNEPQSFFITAAKPLVFSAFLKRPTDAEGRPLTHANLTAANATISFYLQASQKVSLTLSSSSPRVSQTHPSHHKATVGENGGIASIKIGPKDPLFCSDCLFTGRLTTDKPTHVSLTLQPMGFGNDVITLVPGFTVPEQLGPGEQLRFQIYNADRDIMDVTVNLLTGFIDVYLGLNDTVSETSFAEKFSLATTLQSQKLIIIAPFKYNITGPHLFHLVVRNPFAAPASFSVTADKNSLPTPIQHGVTKMVRLAQGEGTNFVYSPSDNDHVALVFELRQVFNPKFADQALSLMGEYLRVMHVDQQNLVQFPVQGLQKSSKGNKVYLAFDVPSASNTHFLVHVYNPVGSGVIGSVNLLNRGYKLLTYNERFVDALKGGDSIVYEAYGQPAKYLFVDLRTCLGDVRIDLFQSNFTNVDEDKTAEVEHLKDANNFIHYVRLQSNKVFLKIRNEAEGEAVYQLNVFGENDIDGNPFRKLVHGDGGKVAVEWDQLRVSFRPVLLRAEYKARFWHRVEYVLYLTDDIRAMKYARNCGSFMVNDVLGDAFRFLVFSQTFDFKGAQDEHPQRRLHIPFEDLSPGVKYFGVIVATVSLFPEDEGILTPVRTETSYYDEFVVKAPHLTLPFERLVGGLFTLAALLLACYLGRVCLCSRVNYRRTLQNPQEYFRSDEVQLDFNVSSILENYLAGETTEAAEGVREVELATSPSAI